MADIHTEFYRLCTKCVFPVHRLHSHRRRVQKLQRSVHIVSELEFKETVIFNFVILRDFQKFMADEFDSRQCSFRESLDTLDPLPFIVDSILADQFEWILVYFLH